MSAIQNYVTELKEINTEIKRLKNATSELKKRAMQIEKNIISYLNEKNIPGVKDKDTAIIIENKKKRIGISKKSAEQESIKILESHGIHDAKNVLQEILNARKGNNIEMQKVSITNINRKK
jgi:hypothetical protein